MKNVERIYKFTVNIDDISVYRSHIMGLAAIGIVLCHSVNNGVVMPHLLERILVYCNLGVDVFLVLSGYGLYFSMRKISNSEGYYKFWIQRLRRVAIPYAIFMIPYWGGYCIIANKSVLDFIYYFSTLSFWKEHIGVWYVALLIPLYLFIAPIVKKLFNRFEKDFLVMFIMVLLLSITGYVVDWLIKDGIVKSLGLLDNTSFVIMRLPAFIIGYYLGYISKKRTKISFLWIISMCFIYAGLNLLHIGLCVYYIPATIFCLLIPKCIRALSKINVLKVPIEGLNIIGKYSLESYLSNYVCVFTLSFLMYNNTPWNIFKGNYVYYLMVIFLGIVLTFVASKIESYIYDMI